ncbi:hypothetical protein KOW79_015917 [Hemibagrus wyckioides]|uniref:G-protein coupled receptors family 1 profile domain-containing protein n=1 Tax=Hemibagrus wyckioides TaxID=337641 RepID=A0A9D3SES2_9TELE|nr:hypothetical protein KOW79_015917 [Hemibagrus wyckioides]
MTPPPSTGHEGLLNGVIPHMSSQNCSIKDFKESVFPTVYLLVFILGVVGHLVSMYIFFSVWRKKRGLTTVNLFMVNLLVSDLMLVCSLPFRASYYMSSTGWKFGKVACSLIFYVFYLNMYTSIYFLVSLNIMRYLALFQPYRYKTLQKWCKGQLWFPDPPRLSLLWMSPMQANKLLLGGLLEMTVKWTAHLPTS